MTDAVDIVRKAIEDERVALRSYERPSETLTLEVLRAIDYAHCRDLFPESPRLDTSDRIALELRKWAINGALQRVMPIDLSDGNAALFTSTGSTADRADEFLFRVGCLTRAEHQLPLLYSGALEGTFPGHKVGGVPLLILSVRNPAAYAEQIGLQGLRWLSDLGIAMDRPKEKVLEQRHLEVLPSLTRHLHGSLPEPSLGEVDDYFSQWAILYLRRMAYRDLLADNDVFGGHAIVDYFGVLVALSTMSQQRLCYAGILNSGQQGPGLRNLLTGTSPYSELVEALADFLDADLQQVADILDHLTLQPCNADIHLQSGTPALAPVVRTSRDLTILPMYGLELNPFVFLWAELRRRYEKEWFEAANRREGRWIAEIRDLFPEPRWSCLAGMEIRSDGRLLTDIDFVVCDNQSMTVFLFQLKWQQPLVSDPRVRRNNASNLTKECNRWIADVVSWTAGDGERILRERFGLHRDTEISVHLVILARYHAHLAGIDSPDPRAIWCDWGNFLRQLAECGGCADDAFCRRLRAAEDMHKATLEPESFIVPLTGRLVILVNPTRTPGTGRG